MCDPTINIYLYTLFRSSYNTLAGLYALVLATPHAIRLFLIYRPDHTDQTRPPVLKYRPTRPDHARAPVVIYILQTRPDHLC